MTFVDNTKRLAPAVRSTDVNVVNVNAEGRLSRFGFCLTIPPSGLSYCTIECNALLLFAFMFDGVGVRSPSTWAHNDGTLCE